MVAAQDEQFTIASLNVDGLPQKVLFLDINANGPGKEGSLRIGKYLAEKSYDMVFMQEDFNFHTELALPMACQYNFDKWSGSVGLLSQKYIVPPNLNYSWTFVQNTKTDVLPSLLP